MVIKLDGRNKEGALRRQQICEFLMERGYVDVGEAATQLGANVATIRRDLEKLEAAGALRRVHGGAYANATQMGVEIDFTLRLNFHVDAKRRIAHRASRLIND